jgi:hypothetical protein
VEKARQHSVVMSWINAHPIVLLPLFLAISIYAGRQFLRGWRTGETATYRSFQDGTWEVERKQNPGWFWYNMALHGVISAATAYGSVMIVSGK